jgi:hypothetical protein
MKIPIDILMIAFFCDFNINNHPNMIHHISGQFTKTVVSGEVDKNKKYISFF